MMNKRNIFNNPKCIFLSILILILVIPENKADTVVIVSDTSTSVLDPISGFFMSSSVASWVHEYWPSITGATWIWSSDRVDNENEFGPYIFTKKFTLPSSATSITGTIQITADNAYELELNSERIGSDGTVSTPPIDHDQDQDHVRRWSGIETYTVTPKAGDNVLVVRASNYGGWVDPDTNPAGIIYRMDVSYTTCTDSSPTAPALTSPDNGARYQVTSVTLDWDNPTSWGKRCAGNDNKFTVYLEKDVASPDDVLTTDTKGFSQFDVSGLTRGSTYYWKVRATNGALGTDSATRNFIIESLAGQSCGNCGTTDSAGTCTGEGVCSSGSTSQTSCGNCGTKTKTCSSSCSWGDYGTCTGEGCAAGSTESRSCGSGGTQSRTCSSSCSWSAWGACTGEFVDIGLRIYNGIGIVSIAAEPGTPASPLRISKDGTTYGIVLVEPTDPQASKLIIQTPSGRKALRKY